MKLLILSFYYSPDLCAGSFRTTSLIEALQPMLCEGDQVDVVTTFPNRYHSFDRACDEDETIGNVHVHRIQLPDHQSGVFDQAKAFVTFFFQVLRYTKNRDYDIVFATSSRLFTAFLGAFISKRKKKPLYLDIRDIFTDTIDSLFSRWKGRLILPVFRMVESYTMSAADKINLVSGGFRDYFERLTPATPLSFFTNGIDDDFLNKDFQKTEDSKKKVITYAGNMGLGQGLEKIIPEIAKATENEFFFRIIGDGGMRLPLEKRLVELNVHNVELHDPVDRQKLLELYRESDYLFLHLNDVSAFEKVLPSKIFEYAATGKPVIAGVKGYSRTFLKQEVENVCLFDPCDPDAFLSAFHAFSPSHVSRDAFIQKYSRRNIMKKMAEDILIVGKCTIS